MLLIILYHFLEVNAVEEPLAESKPLPTGSQSEKTGSAAR